jgi:hypothetical protein
MLKLYKDHESKERNLFFPTGWDSTHAAIMTIAPDMLHTWDKIEYHISL